MLNDLQKQQLEQAHLHQVLRKKGVLDSNLEQEMEVWRQLFIKCLAENQRLKDIEAQANLLQQEKNKLAADIFNLITKRNGLDQKIINYRAKEQELNREITKLQTQIQELTEINENLTNDYQELGNKYQTETQRFNSALKKLKVEKVRLNHWLKTTFIKQKKELVRKIEKEKVLTNSYRGEKNEILHQRQQDQTNFLDNIRDKQHRIYSLEADLDTNDELLAKKNQKITALYQERDNYLSELNELDTDFRRQEELLVDKNTKLVKAIQEKKSLEAQLAAEKQNHQTTQNLVHSLTNQLATKDKLIQQQAERIKELEHKPPVVKTKIKETIQEKEIKIATEYLVETTEEIESETQRKEIQKLKQVIQELRVQLAQQSTPISQIIVNEKLPANTNTHTERKRELVIVLLLATLGTISLLLLITAISKKRNKTLRISKKPLK